MDRNQNLISTTQDITPETGTFFNTLRNNAERKLNKIAVTTLVSLGVLGLTACSGGREPAFEEPAAAETSEPAEPSISEEPTTPETTEPSAFEAALVGEPLEQTHTVEEMKEMPLKDYANLPFADRFAYAYNVVGTESYPTLDLESEAFFLDTPDMTKQLPNHLWGYGLGIAYNSGDPDVRAKLAGGFRYYTTTKGTEDISESYQSALDSAVMNGGEGIGGDYVYNVTEFGELQPGTDRDGNPIDYMNFTYQGGSSDVYETAPEQTTQAIRTEINLLDGTSVIYYAAGYGIDGKASPDDRLPY
jgi:hypothetical protein